MKEVSNASEFRYFFSGGYYSPQLLRGMGLTKSFER